MTCSIHNITPNSKPQTPNSELQTPNFYMTYSIHDIRHILGAQLLRRSDGNPTVEYLLFDSRQVTAPTFSLFFALAGERHDGHHYLAEAYQAGVRHFVIQDPDADLSALHDANVLLVPDTLAALQQLAAHHRSRFPNLHVAGITGSNGKTIVKEWLYQLLHDDHVIVRSPKSYNSQVGVPLSVWQIGEQHTLGIFEAGISRKNEMKRLGNIIRPGIGIFTTLGPAHSEGFASQNEKLLEKMQLFEHAHTLVYCADHQNIALAAQAWKAEKSDRTLFAWSKEGLPADLTINHVETLPDGYTRFRIHPSAAESHILEIPFSDAASLENALHCVAFLQLLGMPLEKTEQRLRRLEPVEMRLELKDAVRNSTLINDAYNNDLASLRIALEFAARQAKKRRLTLILSDILQSGYTRDQLYAQVADILFQYHVDRLVGIGPNVQVLENVLTPAVEKHFFPDTETFINALASFEIHDELILLKGARPFTFERIAVRLEQKAHKTTLEVNLTALTHNLNVYKRMLRPGTGLLVMVKAAGYGSGATELAKLLEFHKVAYLGVAYADEGIELRQAGVQLPILVLNPEPGSLDPMYRFQLEPEVYNMTMLHEVIRFSKGNKPLAIHLKLDTGMHRLGFEPQDMPALCGQLRSHPGIHVRSVFSHLAASDAPAHDAFTHQQVLVFTEMFEQIREALGYHPLRHIANTGGIARFPEYQFDMVRLGIGLYGVDAGGAPEPLRVVNTLKATISQIKSLETGETVGYNRNGPVNKPTRIATISIGYADGLLRLAGNGRYQVGIRGQLAPTIGNVCMDMTMIDITHIPEAREGDEVVVFGENPQVQNLALCLQTIAYEVFTNVSERVKRIYWQE